MEITLLTLTPIWTGGANGKSDRLHMTGIMGSLRWWYEVLIRGVGGRVCDLNKKSCGYDPKEPYQGLCDVCRIFGATGWARRFKLIVTEENLQPEKPAASRIDRSGRCVFELSTNYTADHDPKWYLNGDPLYGNVKLEIVATGPLHVATDPLDKEEHFDPKIIAGLIQLIADKASIGAKPQMGLGVVRVIDHQSTQPLLDHLKQVVALHQKNNDRDVYKYDELPSLHNMFFATVGVDQDHATESETFNLKDDLRNLFRQEPLNDDHLRHTIMGMVRGKERQGAKIMMSYPYDNNIIRIWGWIPFPLLRRKKVLGNIYDLMEKRYRNNFTYRLDFKPDEHGDVLKYLEEHLLKEAE